MKGGRHSHRSRFGEGRGAAGLCFTLWLLFITCVLPACSRGIIPVEVSARAAVIADAGSGKILFEKNADKRFPPASTAKVMTAIVAIEHLPITEEIVPCESAVRVEPTVAGLSPGVGYQLKDLIAAILIKSANDAAVAIAEGVSGSEEGFVFLMNAKAKELGMRNTYFATASGLPTGRKDSQYTTARDLARMMRYALRYRIILETMSQKETYICGSDNRRICLKTHNRALWQNREAPWGKTGYTKEAKRTFVGIDPSFTPRIVFALLQSSDLWSDITILKDRGLEIYDRRYGASVPALCRWIKSQRQRSRSSWPVARFKK